MGNQPCFSCDSNFDKWEPSTADLNCIQELQKEWQKKNFPNAKPYQPLLGLAEEVGELSHAHLKSEQGIRGTQEELTAKKKDAVGDIVIYLAGYCNLNGLDLSECVALAWEQVSKRDWNKNREDGVV
jgi:NTP pyrophosphatase (non-canonical NTP hydrolase)